MMNYITILLFNLILVGSAAYGQINEQKFDAALKLYNSEKYLEAADQFETIPMEKATLFAGKSYYAATNYIQAYPFLNKASLSENQEIKNDALYTLALTHFQQRNYAEAIDLLYPLLEGNEVINRQATTLYNQFLNYFTTPQKKEIYQQTSYNQVRFDLVANIIGKTDYGTAKILYQTLKATTTGIPTTEIEQLGSVLRDTSTYNSIRSIQRISPPEGITYNIGIALPKFETKTDEFNISRSIYLGYLLAAEEYNLRNNTRKVFLQFENTLGEESGAINALHKFVWNKNIDVILGPLFSESVLAINHLSEQYQIPVIAPLANSDTLDNDNPYLFQINPTFSVRGKKMAEYAVNTLNLDTLAVITEKNSLGANSAYAFRSRAEELGAFVPYLFVDDLESKGYDLSAYSDFFTTDSTLIDSLNITPPNGVYAPFTGQGATTLIDLFVTDLESQKNYLTILGSEEWKNADLSENALESFDIYHTQGFKLDTTGQKVDIFLREYKERYDFSANQFAGIAYDTASYLFKVLDMVGNPVLIKDGLKSYPLYQGISTDIYFDSNHVNQSIEVKKLVED